MAGSHGPGGVGRGGHTAGGRPAARGDGDGAARALAPCLETARSLPFDVAPVPCAQGEGAAEASGGWVSEIAAPARCWVPGASPPAGSLALSFALASLSFSLSLSYPAVAVLSRRASAAQSARSAARWCGIAIRLVQAGGKRPGHCTHTHTHTQADASFDGSDLSPLQLSRWPYAVRVCVCMRSPAAERHWARRR